MSTIYFYIYFRAAVAPTAEDVESYPVNVNNVVANDDMHHIRSDLPVTNPIHIVLFTA